VGNLQIQKRAAGGRAGHLAPACSHEDDTEQQPNHERQNGKTVNGLN